MSDRGGRIPAPPVENNEESCQSGSIVFPMNPAVQLLSNQDKRTKDSTKVSRADCLLATGKEAESNNFVV